MRVLKKIPMQKKMLNLLLSVGNQAEPKFFFRSFTDSLPPDEEAFASKACGKKYISNSIESSQIVQSNRKPDQQTSKTSLHFGLDGQIYLCNLYSFIWSLCYSRVDRFIALKWTQGRVRGSQRKVHSRQVEEGSRLTQPVVNFPNTLAITCYHRFKVVSTSQEIMRRSQRKVHSRQIKKVDITCNQLPQPIGVKNSLLRAYLL